MRSMPATPVAAVTTPIDAQAPIGVFDSGVGGLSVLRHVRECLPREDLIYFSDALHAPYGGRSDAQIQARALAIGAFLVEQRVKAIVVACNTATAIAIAALRSAYPALIVVGVEPGLKPAAALSRTGVVGVLGTEATLASQRFAVLRSRVETATAERRVSSVPSVPSVPSVASVSSIRFVPQPCPGLSDLIETGPLDAPRIRSMLHGLLMPLLAQRVDTIVLGCTHYPFVRAEIESLLAQHGAEAVTIVDTGAAVARRLEHVLDQEDMRRNGNRVGEVSAFTSGAPAALDTAMSRLLGLAVVSRQA